MKKKWIKFRHKVIRKILGPFLRLYIKLKGGIKVEKFKSDRKGPFLVLYNHQTGHDQFLVSLSFNFPVYHLASDDLLANGFASTLIKWIAAPIPIKKNVTDMVAVRKCLKIAKEGGTIVIAPEGNRTYSGETCSFNPAIVALIKMLNLPTIIYRIEGGYSVLPRWTDKARKGKAKAYVANIIEKEEIKAMTKDQLHERLKSELALNEYQIEGKYKSNKRAEYLERVAYVCPNCGLSEFYSEGNFVSCKKCGVKVEYTEDKKLNCVNGEFPFNNYLEWYNYQNDFINKLDVTTLTEQALYSDDAKIFEVIPLKKRVLYDKQGKIKLFGDRIVYEAKGKESVALFDEIEGVSVLGRNKLNFYHDGKVYQVKGSKRFNAVKYLNFYHRYLNQIRGNDNGFLGL